jgi:protein TonB
MSVDPHSPQTESSSHSSVIAAMRAFLRKLPVSIFLIVLFVHLGIGAWLLSARFGMTQDNQEQPIFVELLGSDPAEGQDAPEQDKTDSQEKKKAEPPLDPSQAVNAAAATPQEPPPAEIKLQSKPAQPPERPKAAPQKPSAAPETPVPTEVTTEGRGAPATSTQAPAGGAAPLGPRLVSHIDYLGAPPSPVYPTRAKSRKQEGRVVIRVLVDSAGRLRSISVLKSSDFDLLDQAALDAVGKAQFKPYSENGIPLDRLADIPIDFVLQN